MNMGMQISLWDPDFNSWVYTQKSAKTVSMGERIVFSTNGDETTRYPHRKEWIWPSSLHSIHKI